VIVVLILILGLGGTLRARSDLSRIGREELKKRGLTIARELAVLHADQILVNDVFSLAELVNDFLVNYPDVRYIFIVGPGGECRVNSFGRGLPAGLLAANVLPPGRPYRAVVLNTNEGPVYDVVMPVAGGRAGTVRVGILLSELRARVNAQTRQLLLLTGLITLVGAGAGYVLGGLLTRPLARLVEATLAIGRGDLTCTQHVAVRGPDEVARLGRAFNAMTDALAESQRQRDAYNAQLEQRNRELSALNAIAVSVSRSLDLQTVLQTALEQVLALTGLPAGWVFLAREGGALELAAWRNLSPQIAAVEDRRGHAECACQEVLAAGRTQVRAGPCPCPASGLVGDPAGSNCRVSVPLQSRDRALGVMNLLAESPEAIGPEELRLLTAIGHQIGVAVENAQLYAELQQKEALRGQLLRKVIAAQEEERRRIARELHDQYAQALSALSVSLEAAERALPPDETRARAQLRSVQALSAETLDQTYRLIFDLRPTTLDDLGLVPALRWFVETRLQPHGLKVELEAEEFRQRLPAEMETALYRVFQEGLSNVVRHARARHVQIRLAADATRFTGRIRDDGCGFDPQSVQGADAEGRGLGLLGMQERIELLGGQFTIDSAPGRGTELRIEIPLGEAGTLLTNRRAGPPVHDAGTKVAPGTSQVSPAHAPGQPPGPQRAAPSAAHVSAGSGTSEEGRQP